MHGLRIDRLFLPARAHILQRMKKELYEIIATHTGQANDKVWADSDRDYWMTAQEAKDYGMVDEVLIRKK